MRTNNKKKGEKSKQTNLLLLVSKKEGSRVRITWFYREEKCDVTSPW